MGFSRSAVSVARPSAIGTNRCRVGRTFAAAGCRAVGHRMLSMTLPEARGYIRARLPAGGSGGDRCLLAGGQAVSPEIRHQLAELALEQVGRSHDGPADGGKNGCPSFVRRAASGCRQLRFLRDRNGVSVACRNPLTPCAAPSIRSNWSPGLNAARGHVSMNRLAVTASGARGETF